MQNNKAPNEQAIPLLMPQHHMVIPHYMGRSKETDIESRGNEVKQKDISHEDSFYSQSPSENVPLLLPQEANQLDAKSVDSKLKLNGIDSDQCHFDQLEPLIPEMQTNGFVDELDSMDKNIVDGQSDLPISEDWWDVQQGSLVVSNDQTVQVGPRTTCHCQVCPTF